MKKQVDIQRIDSGRSAPGKDFLAVEEALTIRVNGAELVSLLYTPPMSVELSLGYLLSEGLISSMDDVSSAREGKGAVSVELKKPLPGGGLPAVRVLTSGCGGGITFTYPQGIKALRRLPPGPEFAAGDILSLASAFRKMSKLFEDTGGVHSAALSDGREVQYFAEDIGRHNAVDKVFGRCMMDGGLAEGRLLISTGRISSEILLKCVKRGVPLVVSRGAPTSLAIELAEGMGVTVVGFARGRRMNVYTHPERVRV